MKLLNSTISWLGESSRSLTRAAFTVSFFSLVASILGMLRDRLLASSFGAGEKLDIYYTSFRIPDFFFNTLLLSIITSAFLPVLTHYLHNGEKRKTAKPLMFVKDAKEFIDSTISFLVLGILIVAGLLWLTAPFLVTLIAPGFSPEKQETTVLLTRIMLLSPIFLGLSGILGNMLNLRRYFLFYSLAPVMYNLGIIFSIIFLVPTLGIEGLAWGVALGAVFHFLIQFIPSLALGLHIKWNWNPFHKGIKKVLKLMLPRSIHLGLLQANWIIITGLASVLPAGSLTVFNLANNLQGLPLTIFGASFAVAAFPSLATFAARGELGKFRIYFSGILRQILFFVIPLSVLIIILRAQIVRIVLGTGRFDWEDTIATLSVLGVLAISLFAQSVNLLLARAFFALHNTVTPLKAGIAGVAINTGLGLAIIKYWEKLAPIFENQARFSGMKDPIVGIAFAFTISQVVIFIFLFVSLYSKLNGMGAKEIKNSVIKICLATLAMGAVVQAIKLGWGKFFPLSDVPNLFSQILVSSVVGIPVYLYLCKVLKCKEIKILEIEYEKISSYIKTKR